VPTRKKREEEEVEWQPTYFTSIPDEEGGNIWVYCGDYWEQRENKVRALEEGEDASQFLNGGHTKDTAADFRSYEEII